jgi:hypothetical protein
MLPQLLPAKAVPLPIANPSKAASASALRIMTSLPLRRAPD